MVVELEVLDKVLVVVELEEVVELNVLVVDVEVEDNVLVVVELWVLVLDWVEEVVDE